MIRKMAYVKGKKKVRSVAAADLKKVGLKRR
jgi:hypothetical protein